MLKNNSPKSFACLLDCHTLCPLSKEYNLLSPGPLILLILLPLPPFYLRGSCRLKPLLPNPFQTEVTLLSNSFHPHRSVFFFCNCLPVSCLSQSNWMAPLIPWHVTREKFNTEGQSFWRHRGLGPNPTSALRVSV